MTATIRPAVARDAPAVLALWQVAGAEPSHTDDEDSIRQVVEHDPGTVIVAESDGRWSAR